MTNFLADMTLKDMAHALFGAPISLDEANAILDESKPLFPSALKTERFQKGRLYDYLNIFHQAFDINNLSNEATAANTKITEKIYDLIKDGPNAVWYLDGLRELESSLNDMRDFYDCQPNISNQVMSDLVGLIDKVTIDANDRKRVLTLRPDYTAPSI